LNLQQDAANIPAEAKMQNTQDLVAVVTSEAQDVVPLEIQEKLTAFAKENLNLSDADIEQMVRDAEAFAEEDKKRRESAEAKNNAESLVHSTEKQLEEHGDKIDAALKGEIEAAVAETKAPCK
jgi:molecular chaperone DnaK (HSP70)